MKRKICTAERVCDQNGWALSEAFPYQFRLSKSKTSPSDSWDHIKIGDWHLHHCRRLPRHEVAFAAGSCRGVVLGVAVDADGNALTGSVTLDGKGTLDALEEYLAGLAGRFVVVVVAPGAARVYFDPTGGLSAVYSGKDRSLASSVFLAINREIEPEPGISSEQVLAREGQYLLGETCDRHCRRIYANHYLDLKSFELVRHWPDAALDFEALGDQRDQVATEIANRLSQIVAGLTAAYSCALPLSAGTDSRLLLAAATPVLDRIEHFYMHDVYKVTRFDRAGAALLARECGIDLEVIDREDPAFQDFMAPQEVEELRRKMAYRTSMGFDGIDDPTVRAVSRAPGSELILRGNVAEMTRANKWTNATARSAPTPDDGLAALLNMRAEHLEERVAPDRLASLRERYKAWLASLSASGRSRMPDLAHAELFMPTAPNNVYYAFGQNFYINPFNDRRLLVLTAAFHPLARRRSKLVKKIISATRPALNTLPYLADLKKQGQAALA